MTSQLGHRLVIGKFSPPHRGHQHLIETAARDCATVTVLVMTARGRACRWLTGWPGCEPVSPAGQTPVLAQQRRFGSPITAARVPSGGGR
jgi:cytidyltransferase-like protein